LRVKVVYNARKRGEDRASDYFKRTENIAGVKDMRFQALMPDILHWLGITKIDRMLSMSKYVYRQTTIALISHLLWQHAVLTKFSYSMKYDAIVGQG
jgi:GTP cyclohydrolase II